MASPNEDVVLANSEAFNRRDVEGMLELWAPRAAMIDRRAVGWGEYRGHASLRSYYQGMFDNVAALDEALSVVSSEGAVVIVSCHTRAKLVGDPEDELSFAYAMRITLSGGLIESLEIFEDVDAAAGAG